MATGYRVYSPSTGFNTYSGNWMGTITTWAWEYDDHVNVSIQFYTTQKYVNSKVQGTDYFYGSATVNGTTHSFKIAYLGYPGVNSSYTFTTEISIPFDSNGKAKLSFAVAVQGAAGTYLAGYSLGGSLTHEFSNAAKAGTVSLSPSAKKFGDKATIAVSGGEGTVHYKIAYSFGSRSEVIIDKQMTAETAGLYEMEWTIPDLMDECPDAAGGTLKITCETYRFDTLIGTSSVERGISAFSASTIDFTGTFVIGRSRDITINRNSKAYTTTLRYKILQNEGVIEEGITEDSYTWDIPIEFGKLMPASEEEPIYIYCDTYYGTYLVGTTEERYTIKCIDSSVDSRFKPVIDSLKTRVYIPGAPEEFQGLMLQNVSLVDYTVEAHSDASEIAKYTFKGFGKEITIQADEFEGFFAVPADSFAGKHSFNITVTDKRGRTETNYYSWTVRAYSKPKVIPYSVDDANYSAPMCFRSDREGIASGSGTFVRILAGKMCSDVVDDEVNINACKMEYRIRKTGDPWPEEYTELLSYEDSTFASKIIADAFPSTKNSYQVELRVTDLLGFSHSYFAKVSSQKVNFSLLCASDGAAFGKKAELPGVVEIAQDMTLWVRGSLKVDGASWQEIPVNDNSAIWESGYNHGQNKISGCYYRVVNGNEIVIAFNRAIKWSDTPIVLNAEPIPEADRPISPVSMICAAENGFVIATAGTDGFITIDLAWSSKSATQYNWIDGLVYYWKEEK